MNKLPDNLQPILWSSSIDKLDPNKDRVYIIHQILAFGRMEDIHWLFKNYSLKEICTVFLKFPYKNYRSQRFNFVRNFLLPFEDTPILDNKYVINTPRDIRL